jgi:hypothetical protein
MTSGPERPDAARVIKDRQTPWIEICVASASLAFWANNAGIMLASLHSRHVTTAEVAEFVEIAKIVVSCGYKREAASSPTLQQQSESQDRATVAG